MDLQKFFRKPIHMILRLVSFEVLLSTPGHVADGEWWLTAMVVKKPQIGNFVNFQRLIHLQFWTSSKMDPLSPAQPPRKSHSFPDYFSTSQAAPRFRERLLAVTFYAILMLSCQICEKGPTMFCLYTICTIFIF